MRQSLVLVAGVAMAVVVAWWMTGTEQPLRRVGDRANALEPVAETGTNRAPETFRRVAGVADVAEPGATVDADPRPPVVFRIVDGRGMPVPGATVQIGSGAAANACGPSDAAGEIGGWDLLRRLRAPKIVLPVRVAVVGAVAEPIEIDPAHDSLPIELRAPDSGVLEIVCVDGSGAAWPAGPGAAPVRIGVRPLDAERAATTVVAGVGGRARVAPVAIGRRYELGVVLGEVVVAVVEGPRFAGEVRAVELRADPALPLLSGRALTAGGERYSGPLMVDVSSHERAVGGVWVDVGANGAFAVAMHTGHLRGSTRIWLRTSLRGDGEVAVLDRGGPLLSGRNELGDVHLRPAQLLGAGRVVDAAGGRVTNPAPALRFSVDGGDTWRGAAAPTLWLPEGRFEIRDTAVPSAFYEVGLLGKDWPWQRFVPGDRDIVLAPPPMPAGVVEVGVRIESGLPRGTLDVLVTQEVGDNVIHAPLVDRGARFDRSDRRWFRATGVEPGMHRVTVCAGAGRELVSIDGVLVAPDGSCADPRLEDIDLRGRLRTLAITVRDADGVPLPDAAFELRARSESGGWWRLGFRRRFGEGGPDIFTIDLSDRLLVAAEGHRVQEFEVDGPTAQVDLERAPVVRFDVPAELRDAAVRGRVQLILEPVDAALAAVGRIATRAIDPQGAFRAAIACDVDHRVSLRWTPDGGPDHELAVLPAEFLAPSLVDGARIELALAPAALRVVRQQGKPK